MTEVQPTITNRATLTVMQTTIIDLHFTPQEIDLLVVLARESSDIDVRRAAAPGFYEDGRNFLQRWKDDVDGWNPLYFTPGSFPATIGQINICLTALSGRWQLKEDLQPIARALLLNLREVSREAQKGMGWMSQRSVAAIEGMSV